LSASFVNRFRLLGEAAQVNDAAMSAICSISSTLAATIGGGALSTV
jgi:hypothetical protein